MRIGIVCKVIDNYGDAGFSLRLAKALAAQGHEAVLFHDDPAIFSALYSNQYVKDLTLVDGRRVNFSANAYIPLDLLLEPFGSSSEQTEYRFDRALKAKCPDTPWLVIEYLSAEDWIEGFHLGNSVCPSTGHKTSYFYPGFTNQTGGLIHCDYPAHLKHTRKLKLDNGLRLFVFSYPGAPWKKLLEWSKQQDSGEAPITVGIAGKGLSNSELGNSEFSGLNWLPFCDQAEFDELLAQYDVLFVRGEDSFVRAQLAGLPLIWQIYATGDNAHEEKLAHFFKRYSAGLSQECATSLWNCWASWNSLRNSQDFSEAWPSMLPHLDELHTNAIRWRDQLFKGPELVKEVLTWRAEQTPTLMEKTDL
jgi:uncharacterized repeat protein (TIGR03837 family)